MAEESNTENYVSSEEDRRNTESWMKIVKSQETAYAKMRRIASEVYSDNSEKRGRSIALIDLERDYETALSRINNLLDPKNRPEDSDLLGVVENSLAQVRRMRRRYILDIA